MKRSSPTSSMNKWSKRSFGLLLKRRWRLQALIYSYFVIIFQYWENVTSIAKSRWLFCSTWLQLFTRQLYMKTYLLEIICLLLSTHPFLYDSKTLAQCGSWKKTTTSQENRQIQSYFNQFNKIRLSFPKPHD